MYKLEFFPISQFRLLGPLQFSTRVFRLAQHVWAKPGGAVSLFSVRAVRYWRVKISQIFVRQCDDLAARETATERGVPVTGSVGLLVVGIRRGEIDTGTANGWLDDWRAMRGYYALVERIKEILG